MAIQDIDLLIDATTPEQQQSVLLSDVAQEEVMPEQSLLGETPELQDPFTGEEIEVATIKGEVKSLIKGAPRRTVEKEAKVIEEPVIEGLEQVPPQAQPETMAEEVLRTTPEMPAAGKPPETVFNLNQIQGPDSLKQHIEAVSRAAGADKIERMDFGELTAKISLEGYDDAFIKKIIDVNQKINSDPADVYRMMLAVADAGKRNDELAQKINKAYEEGTVTQEMLVEFTQSIELEALLVNGAKGKQADAARALAIMGQARSATVNRGVALDDIIKSVGGEGDIIALARAYSSAPNRSTKSRMAEESIYPLGRRIKDTWFSTWINGLLSGPATHVKNMTANTLYAGLDFTEKNVAVLIGQVRKLMGGKDYMPREEILVDAYSWWNGVLEGAHFMKESFLQNRQITGRSKVEMQQLRDPFNVDVPEDASELYKAMAKAWGVWGKATTVWGRALMSEDEFFKAFHYRRSINTLAYRESRKDFDAWVDSGLYTAEEAEQLAMQQMKKILDNPSDYPDIHKESLDFASKMTFTMPMEGKYLKAAQTFADHPLVKMNIAFFQTPMNIGGAFIERTLFAPLSPKVRADFKAGGIKRDMAVSRVMTSTLLMGGVAYQAINGRITGPGPYSTDMKKGFEAQNWQPYSFVYNKGELKPETVEELKRYTKVAVGEDKIFISYLGLEPIGALTGVGAAIGEYIIMEPDQSNVQQLLLGLGAGTTDYLSELPAITGVTETLGMFQNVGGAAMDEYVLNVFKKFGTQATEFAIGGSPAGAHSSLLAYAERILNPEKKMPRPTHEDYADINPLHKVTLDAIAQYKARNPFFNDSLPQLDPITGERKLHPSSEGWQRAFPFKISEGRINLAYDVLNAYNLGQKSPDKRIEGVELNGQQYNRLIEIATQTKWDGKNNLAQMIYLTPFNKYFREYADKDAEGAREAVDSIRAKAYEFARKQLLEEDPGLFASVQMQKATGVEGLRKDIQQLYQ